MLKDKATVKNKARALSQEVLKQQLLVLARRATRVMPCQDAAGAGTRLLEGTPAPDSAPVSLPRGLRRGKNTTLVDTVLRMGSPP